MSPPTHILHLTSRLDGYGGSRMLRYSTKRQVERGAKVTVGALTADPLIVHELQTAGVDVPALRGRGRWDPVAVYKLCNLPARLKVDLVHVWDAHALGVIAIPARKSHGWRCITTLESADFVPKWSNWIARRLNNWISYVVAADESTEAWLAARGCNEKRRRLIPPGVPTPPPSTRSRADVLGELSLPLEAPLIAVAGPLVRSKRLDDTMWHFELVRVLHPQARLLIVGDGPDRTRLEQFALQVSEPDCVRFLGYRDDLSELLTHVDVYWQLNASPATPWRSWKPWPPAPRSSPPMCRRIGPSLLPGGLAVSSRTATAPKLPGRPISCSAISSQQNEWAAPPRSAPPQSGSSTGPSIPTSGSTIACSFTSASDRRQADASATNFRTRDTHASMEIRGGIHRDSDPNCAKPTLRRRRSAGVHNSRMAAHSAAIWRGVGR